jgi:hypothetical protein
MTITPTATVTPQAYAERVDGSDLMSVALAVAFIGAMGFIVGRHDGGSAVTGMRLFLWCWVIGMIGYVLYGIGALEAIEEVGQWGPVLAGVVGGLVPLVLFLLFGRLLSQDQ